SRIDVDAGEQGEDVCLQDHDQHFEEEDEHSSGEGQDGEELESVRGVEEEEARRREAQDQQQVADHHVREESDRERERLRDELRDELDRNEQDVHGGRNVGQNERFLEVAAEA